MNINYHVHTTLCNHATGTMPDFIRKAISLKLAEICFLDHLTLNPEGKGLTMAREEVALYFHATRNLAHQYRNAISVKVGLEIDFHPDFVGIFNSIVETFDFDVIGGSVHYLGEIDIVTRNSDWAKGKGETNAIYDRYFKQMNLMLDHPFFDVVCHFDLLKKFGRLPQKSFGCEIDGLLAKIKAKNLVLEVNTSGYELSVKEAYPSAEILKKCYRIGIPVTLGSDAHKPNQLVAHYEKAKTLLTRAGYSHLCTFSRRQHSQIPINNT